jgi:NAD(P)H-hydrate epimerase
MSPEGEEEDLLEFLEAGLISPERMRVVDMNAQALGLSPLQLMESAGRALADVVLSCEPSKVLILCGKGNNGGDGLVAARYLQPLATSVILVDQPGMTPECARQRDAARHCRLAIHPVQCREDVEARAGEFRDADVIVDCLLGTGTSGELREPVRSCVGMAATADLPVISADIPTPGIVPDRIVSFHRPKAAGSDVVDIGIPLEAEVFVGPGELLLVKRREKDAHKGAGGKVLVIGGGPYQGAPYLAGLGALRAGADLVRIASPVFEPIPDLIYERLGGEVIGMEHLDRLLELAGDSDVVVIGNGLGGESHDVVCRVAEHCKKAVFDADALRRPVPSAEESIYTPHAGEFTRMTGIRPDAGLASRARVVKEAAQEGTILLKGPVDIISDGRRVRFNRTGSPSMTVGGTGDVLAGVAAAIFCHLPAFESACIAAYVTGKAGEDVAAEQGGGLLASDLPDRIPFELFRRG